MPKKARPTTPTAPKPTRNAKGSTPPASPPRPEGENTEQAQWDRQWLQEWESEPHDPSSVVLLPEEEVDSLYADPPPPEPTGPRPPREEPLLVDPADAAPYRPVDE